MKCFGSRTRTGAATAAFALWLGGCAALSGGSKGGETPAGNGGGGRRAVEVEMPWETTAVRDDEKAPVVKVVTLDDGRDGVPVPYVYGYPIYGQGEALKGILKLRTDNSDGVTVDEREDEHGVIHRIEKLPQLGCFIEGVKQDEVTFVPIMLSCEVPSPKALGGKSRPVVGQLRAGARAKEVLSEPSLEKAFLGDWHLVQGDPDKGKGIGYFNTDHGQLAFEFENGRLAAVDYYFDPPHKPWQEPLLWSAQ